ncbi:MAG: hypothetical protein QG552_3382 [Thermodesulfobacteriota bacterium]|nr:hypothetical protein [Thermodesulfobacteriota bacterium]
MLSGSPPPDAPGHVPTGDVSDLCPIKSCLSKEGLHLRVSGQKIAGNSLVRAVVCGKLLSAHEMGDNEEAADFKHPAHLSKGLLRLIEMRERCKADDSIEYAVNERDTVDIPLKNHIPVGSGLALRLADHLQGQVKGADLTGRAYCLAKVGEEDPRPGTHVKESFPGLYFKRADQIEKTLPHRGRVAGLLPMVSPCIEKTRL